MISIVIHLHFYFYSSSTSAEPASYFNQASSKSGSGYNYMPDTFNHSPQEREMALF